MHALIEDNVVAEQGVKALAKYVRDQ